LLVRWGPVLLWAAAIFIASSISQPPSLPAGVTDKHVHGTIYAILSVLIVRGLIDSRWSDITLSVVLVAIVLAALYGASDEFHQAFVPGRTSDVADLMADAFGATAGAVAAWLAGRLGRSRASARI
jgi:VanZ family protein